MQITAGLIVFTRYPQPGQTKTRLIPRLGAEGAAALQRQLTEHTLNTVQAWLAQQTQPDPTDVVVCFTGCDRPMMQTWLGEQWTYRAQGTGDLGDRLLRAFQDAASERDRVIAIGIDCPGITPPILHQAVAALHTHDLVLGPAVDGGYYLIGMKQVIPDLFTGIAWSTDQVLAQTMAIAQALNLSIAMLEPLADIDYPEDLAVWYQICAEIPRP